MTSERPDAAADDAPALPDPAEVLAGHPLTASLPLEVRARLAVGARMRALAPGEVLVEEGSPGDAAFLIVTGRLTASVGGRAVGTIGRDETVGEMSLITGAPRSATVTARRPSVVLVVRSADFAAVLADHPEAHRSLTRQLVARLDNTLRGRGDAAGHAAVMAVVGGDDPAVVPVVDVLVSALADGGADVARLGADRLDELAGLEVDHDVVVVAVPRADVATLVPLFDRVVAVARIGAAPAHLPDGLTDLIVVHPDRTVVPAGTRRLLRPALAPTPLDADPLAHHHLRLGSTVDAARLARRLLGRERVLVLGGGGARGMAHLGAYRAVHEAGIELDAVVGVSAGAIFAACIALDWSPEEAVERSSAILIDAGRLVDFTAPLVALSSGRRVTEAIQNGFGIDVDLEDLWRPLMCLSADLTTLTVRYHRRGPLWRALRASVAVPGVFPPLIEGEAVLVDGGVVDNLPVTPARLLYPGATIISSDVGRRNEPMMTVELPPDGIVSGWRSLWHRVGRRRQTPTLVKLLYRLTALGGGAADLVEGDIHVCHELEGVGMFDFARARPAIEAGYQQTRAVLAADDRVATLMTRGRVVDRSADLRRR
ncbi:MAG: patatin-like phospholipase family protein [Acidimicrobiales bacterium]